MFLLDFCLEVVINLVLINYTEVWIYKAMEKLSFTQITSSKVLIEKKMET
jgi:hypothetical protein